MKMYCIQFNDLTPNQLYDMLQLRISVFIVEQQCIYQDLDDKDRHSHHLLSYDDQVLAGTTRIVPPGISYEKYASIGRVASLPLLRKKGIGMELMKVSIQKCNDLYPEYPIKISAQSYLLDFYGRFGFIATGEEYLEDNIPHTAMILVHT
jgi:ElaA protein